MRVPLADLQPDSVPRDRVVVAVCRSGNRSGQAAVRLAAAGVRNMAGGMKAWAERELGYPVDGTTGTAGGYRLASGPDLPPLLLDDEEAVAVAVGLTATAGTIAGIEETAVLALAKLRQVLPARLRARVDAVAAATTAIGPGSTTGADADVVGVLATACRDHELVRFGYSRRDGSAGHRRVEPHRLVTGYGLWYLVAFDPGRRTGARSGSTASAARSRTRPTATGRGPRSRRRPSRCGRGCPGCSRPGCTRWTSTAAP